MNEEPLMIRIGIIMGFVLLGAIVGRVLLLLLS